MRPIARRSVLHLWRRVPMRVVAHLSGCLLLGARVVPVRTASVRAVMLVVGVLVEGIIRAGGRGRRWLRRLRRGGTADGAGANHARRRGVVGPLLPVDKPEDGDDGDANDSQATDYATHDGTDRRGGGATVRRGGGWG